MMTMEIHDNLAVFGENECIYQCVLDDFKNAKFIGIITFNISSSTNSQLLKSLQEACSKGRMLLLLPIFQRDSHLTMVTNML